MERPILKLKLTLPDQLAEIAGWLLVAGIWTLTIISYGSLPQIIPVHYNGLGEADAFGDKTNLLALPIVSTVLFLALTVLNRFPHVMNYPTDLTPENAPRLYTNATRLLRYMKLIVMVIFGMIEYQTIENTKGDSQDLGRWFLPFVMGIIFLPIAYFLLKSFREKDKL